MRVPTAIATTGALLSTAQAQLYNAPVLTLNGLVQGYQALNDSTVSNFRNWKDITVWKGIPFAASTAGENRWQPPQPVASFNGTFLAKEYGPGCPTMAGGGPLAPESSTSEDCLSVNIWSPAKSSNESLPVAVWNYGAGATSSDDNFDGAGVANHGIVFVTYNYRTGPLGWLATPELSAENPRNISGNYGLFDQIHILDWVQKNIAAFGGDPNHVTTVGQSFGAGAVLHQINSPLTKGLIVGAIAESGIKYPYDPTLPDFGSGHVNYTFLYPFSKTFMDSLNATSIAQLRNLTVDQILSGTGASAFVGFDPVVDGYAIPYSYEKSLQVGPANDVPVLVGNNRDEDGVNVSASYDSTTYYPALQEYYGDYWAKIFGALYPPRNDSEAGYTAAFNAQMTNEAAVSTWLWANAWAKTANSSIYTYEWNHAPPGTDGATHGSEIDYVLNSLYADDMSEWQANDYAIANVMSSYWANFIKTGNPNKGGSYKIYNNGSLAHWPPSSASKQTTFSVGNDFMQSPITSSMNQTAAIAKWFRNVTRVPQ